MQQTQTDQNQPQADPPRGGLSLQTIFIVLMTLVVLCSLAALYAWRTTLSDKAKLEQKLNELQNAQKKAEIERQKGAEESRQALARTKQNEVLLQARQATNALAKVLADLNATTSELSALRTSDAGRGIAQHPDLVIVARRIYESELAKLPAPAEVIQRIEAVRRVEQQLMEHAGTAYEPDAQVTSSLNQANYWTDETGRSLQQVRVLKESLLREAKVKVAAKPLDDTSPSLDTALKKLNEAENRQAQQIIIDQTDGAKRKAAEREAEAEVKRIIADAEVRARRMIEDAEAKIKENEAEERKREALRKSNEIQSKLQAKSIVSDAEKKLLMDKASQPDVRAKLAPFITPGYWTPTTKGLLKGSVEKRPLSYTKLQGFGALGTNFDGLQKLVNIGIDRDNDRPRWENIKGPSAYSWRRSPEKVEFVKGAQALLIELGPVLVEMKLLLE
jgi:hypothetical protein